MGVASLVHSQLFSLPEYQKAKTLSIFMSMPAGEVLTEPIVYQAFDQGKSVFIPYLRKNETNDGPNSVMDMVELHSRDDFKRLAPDKWGIPSLKPEAIPGRRVCPGDHNDERKCADLDLIIMPGVAFDKKLQRIGHGKGYYDFFLKRYQRNFGFDDNDMPFLVAIALEQQLLPDGQEVPIEKSDWPMNALIVGDGLTLRR